MFETLIENAKQSILEKVDLSEEYCYLSVLDEADIDERLKFYTEAAVEWWIYEDQMQRGLGNNLEQADPALEQALSNIKSLYKKAARIESQEAERFFALVASNVLNFLTKPTQTLKEFIYADSTSKPVREIMLRVAYFTEYQYFKNHLSRCFANRDFEIDYEKNIPVGNFVDYIIEADMDVMMSSGPGKVIELLRPMHDFFVIFNGCNEGEYSIEALGIFFDDKGNEDVRDLLLEWSRSFSKKNIDEESLRDLIKDYFTVPDENDLTIDLDGLAFNEEVATEVEEEENTAIDAIDDNKLEEIEQESEVEEYSEIEEVEYSEIEDIEEVEYSEIEDIEEVEYSEIEELAEETIISQEEMTEDIEPAFTDENLEVSEENMFEEEIQTENPIEDESKNVNTEGEYDDFSDALDGFDFEGMDLDVEEMPDSQPEVDTEIDSEELSEKLEEITYDEIRKEEAGIDDVEDIPEVVEETVEATIEETNSDDDIDLGDLDLESLADALEGEEVKEIEEVFSSVVEEIEEAKKEILEMNVEAVEQELEAIAQENKAAEPKETFAEVASRKDEEYTIPQFEIEDFSDDFAEKVDEETLSGLHGEIEGIVKKDDRDEVGFDDDISKMLYNLDDESEDEGK
jgi:hypothetical protein